MAAHQMATTPSGMPHPSVVMASQYAHWQPQPQLHYQHVQKQQLQAFWQQQIQEIEQVNEFGNHQLPSARIKTIMKSDEDVKDEDVAVPWSGGSGEAVPYGNMYYPAQPMHHLMAVPEMMVAQPAVVQTPPHK